MLRVTKFVFAFSSLMLIAAVHVPAQENPIQVDMGKDGFINDRTVYESLSKIGKELYKDDSLLKSSEILEQLNELQSSARLDLAKPSGDKSRKRSFDSTVIVGFLYDCGKCDQQHMGIATGVAISSDGLILTNHHVLDNDSSFIHYVMTRDGKVFPVEKVVACHEANDIALIKIDTTDLPYSSIAPVAPKPLDDLYTISHPEMNFFYASSGQVARYVEREKGNVKTRWLQLDGEFAGGSSGGPVFDNQGHVVGLMTRQIPKLAKKGGHLRIMFHECVPVQVINDFIKGKLENPNSLASFKKEVEDAGDREIKKIYRALVKNQRDSSNAFYRSRRDAAKNKDIDLEKLERTHTAKMKLIANKMMVFTEVQNVSISLDAYAFVLGSYDYEGNKSKVADQMLARHLDAPELSDKLESFCVGMLNSTSSSIMEMVAKSSTNKKSQGIAKFLLATNSKSSKVHYAKLLKNAGYTRGKPKDLEYQKRIAVIPFEEIAEKLESVKEDYGTVEYKDSTLGDLAAKELRKLEWSQNLEVGKIAPEIEGPDLDGETFKLSDYRGKIVMLDFWGDW